MHFYEHPTNVAAHASSGGERSRWRNEGIDPELTADPFDTLQAVQKTARQQQNTQYEAAITQAQRPLSLDIAQQAIRQTSIEVQPMSPTPEAVQRSFNQ